MFDSASGLLCQLKVRFSLDNVGVKNFTGMHPQTATWFCSFEVWLLRTPALLDVQHSWMYRTTTSCPVLLYASKFDVVMGM